MSKDYGKPIRKIHLADQQFANQIVGKYGWRIDNGFARSKLQHRMQPKQNNSMAFSKSPIIHLTKVIQPLHLKLIYEYHQLNQMIEYKNSPLLVSSPMSNGQWGTTVDSVANATKQHVSTLLEKVKHTVHLQAERKLLQQVQSQIEHKTLLTTSHLAQHYEESLTTNVNQATARLIRIPIDSSNQASNRMLTESPASGEVSSLSRLSIKQPADGLHHIDKITTTVQSSKRQVAAAKMILSPYIRNIVREEQERITVEMVERNDRSRTKATLHGLIHRALTPHKEQVGSKPTSIVQTPAARVLTTFDETPETRERVALSEIQEATSNQNYSIARKAIINHSTSISLERWKRKLTIEKITMLRQQKRQLDVHLFSRKVRHDMTRNDKDQSNHLQEKSIEPQLKHNNVASNSSQLSLQHIQRKYALTQTNLKQQQYSIEHQSSTKQQLNNTEHHSISERQTIINDMRYYLKTTSDHIERIKHHQKIVQHEQKLVYIPFVNKENTGVNEKVKLIYRNLLTQVDSRISNNQHSYKQEIITNNQLNNNQLNNNVITNNEHLHKQEGKSNSSVLPARQMGIIKGEANKQQWRHIEANTVQIRSVTSFHQQLIKRNERLIYQIEMVEKKKTPRARKMTLLPVVKLTYRVLPEEQRKRSIHMPEAQSHSPLLLPQNGIRRQAQLIHTVKRNQQRANDIQVTQQVLKQSMATNTSFNVQQISGLANGKQSEGRMDQVVSSSSISNELIMVRPQNNIFSVTGQLTHISKVNKTQLLQVKVLQSKLKQLQAVTLVKPRTIITDTKDISKAQHVPTNIIRNENTRSTTNHLDNSVTMTDNDRSISITQKQYSVNHSHSKQLYYRLTNGSGIQQLGVIIAELQKSGSHIVQDAANKAALIDVPSNYKPLSITSTIMNSIVTKRINLIHSSQQQSERLTKRLKQLGGAILINKVNDIISTQSPLSIVQIRTTNEQDLQLVASKQHSKSKSQIVEQVRQNTQSTMNLHIAKQQSMQQNMQQNNTKQADAVKQLELTVKRLEQEINVAKETTVQPNINVRQLSDQLFDQISKKIRLEQHRNGR